jgi:hypothetical protein
MKQSTSITSMVAHHGLFNEQKALSCGRLSDRMIAGRMLQRVIENNAEKISNYKPCADYLKIP